MAMPRLERNGISEDQEAQSGNIFGSRETLTAEAAPKVEADSPVKQVVFRSSDKELVLYFKAGYTDRSHGISTYTPSIGVKFEDYYARFDDTPENAKTIAWLRKHPVNGVGFIEVPDMSNIVELPTIAQLRQMTIDELKGLCSKHAVKHEVDASKEALILALVEKAR